MNILDTPLQWTDTLATGVEEIDSQHHYLLHAINQAREELLEANALDRLEPITRELLAYALFHFETEETLMEEYGYPAAEAADAERHCREHRDFSASVLKFREALNREEEVSVEALLQFLEHWLIEHIMQTDQQLGRFIREKRGF